MYNVHKFMDLNATQFGYFVQEVGLAALSFGVDPNDLVPVATALGTLFGQRCAPVVSVLGGSVPAEPQSICIDESCTMAPNGTCDAYGPAVMPLPCNGIAGHSGPSNSTSSTSAAQATATSAASSMSSGNQIVYGSEWWGAIAIFLGLLI
jgi:hypothetical protein